MTVSVAPRYQNFNGNGTTGPFSFNFYVLLQDDNVTPDAIVTKIDASGNQTVLNYPADYSFVPVALGQGGGIITTTVAVPNDGSRLFVEGNTPLDQETAYRNQGAEATQKFESSFDKLTLIAQETLRQGSLAIRIPNSDITGTIVTLPSASLRANNAIVFDASGNVTVGAVSGTVVSAAMVPVVQASTVSAALALLGGLSSVTAAATYATLTSLATTNSNVSLKANIASPTFTGTPIAPTPSAGDLTTKIATMANFGQGANGATEVLLGTVTITSSTAAATFASIPAGYDRYILRHTNFLPVSNGVDALIWASENNGSSYLNTGWQGETWGWNTSNGSSVNANPSTGGIRLGVSVPNGAASPGLTGEIMIGALGSSAAYKNFNFQNTYGNVGYVGFGWYNTDTNAFNALQMYFASGNIASGKLSLYGVRNT